MVPVSRWRQRAGKSEGEFVQRTIQKGVNRGSFERRDLWEICYLKLAVSAEVIILVSRPQQEISQQPGVCEYFYEGHLHRL